MSTFLVRSKLWFREVASSRGCGGLHAELPMPVESFAARPGTKVPRHPQGDKERKRAELGRDAHVHTVYLPDRNYPRGGAEPERRRQCGRRRGSPTRSLWLRSGQFLRQAEPRPDSHR
jgi:hypothetical protein